MNILFVSDTPILPNKGGIERVSYLLAQQFKKLGHEVEFLSTNAASERSESNLSFPQHYIDCSKSSSLNDMKMLIENLKCDVIINQTISLPVINLLHNSTNNDTILLTVLHNRPFASLGFEDKILQLTYPTTFKGKLIKILTKSFPKSYGLIKKRQNQKIYHTVSSFSSKLILLSERFKERLISNCPGINSQKIDAINNPNTFSFINENTKCKENLLIFVGRLVDPQKNVKGFIDVWQKFHRLNPNWNALIIGDGPHRAIFENYSRSKDIKNLTFMGNRSDVSNFYQKAKILCMTSTYEGWPMVLPEALAYGCVPVVYDTFESCHEIISNNKNGIIVEPFNEDMMVKEIDRLAKNREIYCDMSNYAKSSIAKFSPEYIASIWIKKIEQIMNCPDNNLRNT